MSAIGHRNMNGHLYIGLDFGMALTKVAVWAKLFNERAPTRFVVEFPRDHHDPAVGNRARAPHVPSALWVGNGRIYGIPPADARRLARIDDIKRLLLESWTGSHAAPLDAAGLLGGHAGWSAEKLAILKLAFVLRHVDRKVAHWSAFSRPGACWGTLVNAAIPPEEGTYEAPSKRTRLMRWLIERAWLLAKSPHMRDDGLALPEALRCVDAIYSNPPLADDITPVEVIPEALAAACSHITSNHASVGDWLTVDVGALTTDTSYFFFNPAPEYQIACYSTLRSMQVGMSQLTPATPVVDVRGIDYLPHHAIELEPSLVSKHPAYWRVVTDIGYAIRATAAATARHQGGNIGAVLADGRHRFKILLVGGGSAHSQISPRIRDWIFEGLGPVEKATCVLAKLPQGMQLLTCDAKLVAGTFLDSDHAILTIAAGLAQRRIDLPRWCHEAPAPRLSLREAPDNPYLGHN